MFFQTLLWFNSRQKSFSLLSIHLQEKWLFLHSSKKVISQAFQILFKIKYSLNVAILEKLSTISYWLSKINFYKSKGHKCMMIHTYNYLMNQSCKYIL